MFGRIRLTTSFGVAAALATTAVAGCGVIGDSEPPTLTVKDLPLEYKSEGSEGVTTFLPDCQGENLVQRYGEDLTGERFVTDNGGDFVILVSVKMTDEQMWEAVVDAVENCEPQDTVSTNGDVISTTAISQEVVPGPNVGEDRVWITRNVELTTSVDYLLPDMPDDGPTNIVVVKNGDYIFTVSASQGGQQAIAELVEKAID